MKRVKNRKCPNKSCCFDYECSACEICDLGDHILKLHKRIDRLKAKNKKLKAENTELKLLLEDKGGE